MKQPNVSGFRWQNGQQFFQGLRREQFHASRTEEAFSDREQFAGLHLAERPVGLGRSAVNSQDKLL